MMESESNRSDDVSDIAAFYNGALESEQGRLEHHQLEYDLTCRYLNEYLPAEGAILEVGAATGRYTLELAKRGYAVTAVDLSEVLLAICRQKISDEGFEGQVRFLVADARNLSEVPANQFDAVLLMGPLYHLITETDRKSALREAFARLRNGGVILSAFISRFGVLSDLIKDKPAWIEDQEEVSSVLANGRRPDHYPRGGFRGYLALPGKIAPLHEEIGFETLVTAAVEPVIAADDESYNRLEGKQRDQWLDLLYAISQEPSIIGASRHLLYIGRKPVR